MIKMLQYKMYPADELRCPTTALVCHGGHLGFVIGMILAIFDLQITPMLPTKCHVS